MSPSSATATEEIVYPYTDGQPMGESHLQFTWIHFLFGNINSIFTHRNDVFVSGNNFLYPVHGQPGINIAPDVYVAFGRPKQKQLKSYKLWEQGNVFPQVVIELISLSNSPTDMLEKLAFCEQYGCEEYIEINPYTEKIEVWTRERRKLHAVTIAKGWTSPLMGVRFVPTPAKLLIYHPDGTLFRSSDEIQASEATMKRNTRKLRRSVRRETERAEAEAKRAETEAQRAETEAQRAETEAQRANSEQAANERLRELLRRNGIDPDKH